MLVDLTERPRVSVLLAAHKSCERYFREAIESVVSQTFRNWELVISDDSATPKLQEISESFSDPRIHYVSQPAPLGPHGNHLAAFQQSRGELIAILNHDDVIYSNFLEELVPMIDLDVADVAFCDHDVIDAGGLRNPELTAELSKRWGRTDLVAGVYSDIEPLVVSQSISVMNASLFKRELLGELHKHEVGPAYDIFVSGLFLQSKSRATYNPKRLSAWRVHSNNISSLGSPSWSRGAAESWEFILRFSQRPEFKRTVHQKIQKAWLHCFLAHLELNEYERAREIAIHLPFLWRNLAASACRFPRMAKTARYVRSSVVRKLKLVFK